MQPYLSLNPRCNLFVDLFANFLLAIFVVNELIRHALRLQVCKKVKASPNMDSIHVQSNHHQGN